MNKNLKKKKKTIKAINILANNSISTIIVDYSRIKSLDFKYIRRTLFVKNIDTKVLKNSLAKKGFEKTKNEALTKNFAGQIFTIFSKEKISLPIKIINNLQKDFNNLQVKSICVHGKLFSKHDIKKLINLPNKKYIIVKFAKCLKLPMINIINCIKYPYKKLLILLKLILKKKERENYVNK